MYKLNEYFYLFKISHLIKNLLIFLPIIAAHSYSNTVIYDYIIYFLNISVTSVLVYLLNNINDYKDDLINKTLRYKINLEKKSYYYFFATAIFFIQSTILIYIDFYIFIICASYLILSITYNLFLKFIRYIDIFTIGLFHMIRIYYGAYVFDVELSQYFLIFCLSIFLMIGSNKRLIEIKLNYNNRPYTKIFQNRIEFIQFFFAVIAIFTFFLYIIDPSKNILFTNHIFLYVNLVIVALMIINFLYFNTKKEQDVISFVYKNKTNCILTIIFFVAFFWNSLFFLK